MCEVRKKKPTVCFTCLQEIFYDQEFHLISGEMSRIISQPCLHEIWCSRCLFSQVDRWQIWENNSLDFEECLEFIIAKCKIGLVEQMLMNKQKCLVLGEVKYLKWPRDTRELTWAQWIEHFLVCAGFQVPLVRQAKLVQCYRSGFIVIQIMIQIVWLLTTEVNKRVVLFFDMYSIKPGFCLNES